MIGNRNRQIKLRQYPQRYSANAASTVGVGYPVREARITVIAGTSGKNRRVTVHHNRAIVTIEHFYNGEAIVFDITVIDQQCGQIDRQWSILIADKYAVRVIASANTIWVGIRRIVNRRDIECKRAGRLIATIGYNITESRYSRNIFGWNEAITSTRQALDMAQTTI